MIFQLESILFNESLQRKSKWKQQKKQQVTSEMHQ
jgi:hypothetical protein